MTLDDKFAVLSDIQGMEDFSGDMDFKVAGTADGVTAIQLDCKIQGLPREVMVQALEQARIGQAAHLGQDHRRYFRAARTSQQVCPLDLHH